MQDGEEEEILSYQRIIAEGKESSTPDLKQQKFATGSLKSMPCATSVSKLPNGIEV